MRPRPTPPSSPALAQRAVIALVRTADVVRRRFASTVYAEAITLQQFNVLRILRGAGPAGLPTLTIGDRMVEKVPGVTRLLDRLERKRLVRRERRTDDRRQVHITITDGGRTLLARLDAPIVAADESVLAPLAAAERETLIQLLDAVHAAALGGPAGPSPRRKRAPPTRTSATKAATASHVAATRFSAKPPVPATSGLTSVTRVPIPASQRAPRARRRSHT